MAKEILIPKNISYISDYGKELDNLLPKSDRIIIDKGMCGIGLTYHYLSNDKPVILLSPRRELIHSKMINETFYNKLFYFHTDNKSYYNDSLKAKRLAGMKESLKNYLLNSSLFTDNADPPKILICYDSILSVLSVLFKLNVADKFVYVVDECQTLCQDQKMKGRVDYQLLNTLMTLPSQTILISATPLADLFIKNVSEFRDFREVRLKYDESVLTKVLVRHEKIKSRSNPTKIMCELIQRFRDKGFFESKVVDEKPVFSKEALFFVNQVSTILQVAKKMNLSDKDTLVVVGENDKNLQRLSKIGLSIGHFSSESDYKTQNKPFTFITRTAFSGSDIYSDTASTYIFSDPNSSCLTNDLLVDIPQIAGRIRTKTNPFRTDITLYFRTYEKDVSEVEKEINQKKITTLDAINRKLFDDPILIDSLEKSQEVEHYDKHYLEVIYKDGEKQVIFNELAYADDLRSLDCYKNQYQKEYNVISVLSGNSYKTEKLSDSRASGVVAEILKDRDFVRRIKYCVEIYENDPELYKELIQSKDVPDSIINYINELGVDRIKANSYYEKDLAKELALKRQQELIKNRILEVFPEGKWISRTDTKKLIKKVYNEFGLDTKSKGSDIEKYIPNIVEKKKNGTRGYYRAVI